MKEYPVVLTRLYPLCYDFIIKSNTRTSLLIITVLAIIGGVVLRDDGNDSSTETDDKKVVNPIKGNQEQQTKEVQYIHIPKKNFEGATKDLELAVGDVYGNFTISKIVDNSHGPDSINFIGEETLRGWIGYSTFGSFYFEVEEGSISKLPQIIHDVQGRTIFPGMILIPRNTPDIDFVYDETGNSKPRFAEIRVTNLDLVFPPIDAFGSFEISQIKLL